MTHAEFVRDRCDLYDETATVICDGTLYPLLNWVHGREVNVYVVNSQHRLRTTLALECRECGDVFLVLDEQPREEQPHG